MTRTEILDANEWANALEEADDIAEQKARVKLKQNRR